MAAVSAKQSMAAVTSRAIQQFSRFGPGLLTLSRSASSSPVLLPQRSLGIEAGDVIEEEGGCSNTRFEKRAHGLAERLAV